MMIGIKEAIQKAEENLKDIQKSVSNIRVEQAIVVDDLFEVTLSYKVNSDDEIKPIENKNELVGLGSLYALSSFNRLYKTFLIDKTDGGFKGFKQFKEA